MPPIGASWTYNMWYYVWDTCTSHLGPFELTELAGGVREGQNLPQNGLNLALEPSRGPQIGQWTLKWTQMDPSTALDWLESISWPFKALQPLHIKKNIKYLIWSKILFSDISTLLDYRGQLRHFLNGFVIFLSIPSCSILRKITKPFKKCLSWPR